MERFLRTHQDQPGQAFDDSTLSGKILEAARVAIICDHVPFAAVAFDAAARSRYKREY